MFHAYYYCAPGRPRAGPWAGGWDPGGGKPRARSGPGENQAGTQVGPGPGPCPGATQADYETFAARGRIWMYLVTLPIFCWMYYITQGIVIFSGFAHAADPFFSEWLGS